MTELIQVSGNKGKGGQPSESSNTLLSTATARVVDLLCEGEIEGFFDQEHPERSIYFDNVPMMEDDATLTIHSILADKRRIRLNTTVPPNYSEGRTIRVVGCTNQANNGDFTIEKLTDITNKTIKDKGYGSIVCIVVTKTDYTKHVDEDFNWKANVRAATTVNGTLATAFANSQVIDGVTLATGNRILLKNQTTGAANGIYTVNASGAPTRATDADTSAEVTSGMSTLVQEGTTNGNTQWALSTNNPITLGTTALTFVTPPGSAYIALMNFKGADLEVRYGTPDQLPLVGISEVEATFEKNMEVKFDTTVYFQITNPNIDDVKINLRFSSLVRTNSDGDVGASTVEFRFLRRWVGGDFVEFDRKIIKGKTTSDYEVQYRYSLTSGAFLVNQPVGNFPLDIQVDRLTVESSSVKKQDTFYLNSWVEVQNVKLQYPNCALAGLKVVAELFGGRVPQRSYHIKGLKIAYPSNYTPATQVYSGFWDGTFTTGWCDNPAWVFYDILTNKRYGLGEYVNEDQVDKYSLYEIAKYCDCVDENNEQTLISNGYGGTERRFVFNGAIEAREEAYTVLQALASVFRGMAYWSAGGVASSQDSPKDYTRLVSRANVVGGDFTYTGTALKARHTAALITWNDPQDNYKQAVEVVEDHELINTYGWRPIEVVAFATTSRGQANRVGKWILDSERYETETVTFTAGVDFQNTRPGEIIAISDPARTGVRRGGRILSYAAYSGGGYILYIDMPYASQVGDTLLVLNTDDAIVELNITPGMVGAFLLVTVPVTDPVTELGTLQPDAMFVIQNTTLVPETWRVLSMRETEPHLYEITALQYDGSKFARVEANLSLPDTPTSYLPTGKLAPPSGMTMVENLVRNNNYTDTVLDVSWTASPDPRAMVYVFEYQPPGGPWSAPIYTNDVSYKITGAVPSKYSEVDPDIAGDVSVQQNWNFRVRAQKTYEAASTQSIPAHLSEQVVVGKTLPPANVTGFRATRNFTSVLLRWDAVSDIDLLSYEIVEGDGEWPMDSLNPGHTDRASSRVLVLSHVSTRHTVPCETKEYKTYQIRAVDDSGNVSVLPAQVTRDGTIFGTVFPTIPAVSLLEAYQDDNTVYLAWVLAGGGIGFGYEVRIGTTGDTWATATPFGDTTDTQFSNKVAVMAETTYRFRVRTYIQWAGGRRAYGDETTVDLVKYPQLGLVLIVEQDEHADGWPGTLSASMEVDAVSGDLRLMAGELVGTYHYTLNLGTERTGRLFKVASPYFDLSSGLLIDNATQYIADATGAINPVTNDNGVANINFYLEMSPDRVFRDATYKFTSVVIRIEFTRTDNDQFVPALGALTTYFHDPS